MKQQIINAVLLEIADSGLSNLTLKAVAARADTSISLITHHFVNRAGLLAAVAKEWQGRLQEAERECLSVFLASPTPAEGLEAAVICALNIARQHQAEIRMVLRQVVVEREVPSEIREFTLPLAERTAELASQAFGVPRDRARAILHQTAILLTRMSLLEDSELQTLYGAAPDGDAWTRCCSQLGRTIRLAFTSTDDALLDC